MLGQTFVLSHGVSASVSAVAEDLKRSPRLLKKGPVWVVHALLDHLIDDYLPVLDTIDVHVEELEDAVLASAESKDSPDMMRSIFSMKRSLYALRRVSVHQRDILLRLSRAEFDEIPREAMPFFRDVYDHFTRVTDMTDNYRDLVTNAFEGYMSVQSHRMNQIMKTLTLISTVMLPLTFIAGVYGMNFHAMPELSWQYGYPFALTLMAVVGIAIVVWFKVKRWVRRRVGGPVARCLRRASTRDRPSDSRALRCPSSDGFQRR
ncbi:MAG: magnesium/cobalt transporter CorA [Polyangiaceae bacterium]